jgi:hypothetical protein
MSIILNQRKKEFITAPSFGRIPQSFSFPFPTGLALVYVNNSVACRARYIRIHTDILPVVFRESQTLFLRNIGPLNYEISIVRALQGVYQINFGIVF